MREDHIIKGLPGSLGSLLWQSRGVTARKVRYSHAVLCGPQLSHEFSINTIHRYTIVVKIYDPNYTANQHQTLVFCLVDERQFHYDSVVFVLLHEAC